MPLFHLVILAVIQGITEFLPISSSGHLVLAHELMETHVNAAQDLTMDIAVHVGTLFAVLVYFYRDLIGMFEGLFAYIKDIGNAQKYQKEDPKARASFHLALMLVVASIPVIIAGLALHEIAPDAMRTVKVMGWTTLIFGVVLWWADRAPQSPKTMENIGVKESLIIGFAQILALIPGTSRSGITMTAARWLGYSRTEAARFSLLLAIIAISGAGTLTGIGLLQSGDAQLGLNVLIGIALSFVSALIAMHLMMKWLERASFTPFAIYRVILGVVLLGLAYGGVVA